MPKTAIKKTGRPSAGQAEQKRQAILAAAHAEFVDSGFRGASMRRIAERADVSTRTLYNQYADKQTLFGACLEHSSQLIEIDLRGIRGGNLEERLHHHALELQKQMGNEAATRFARLLYREGLEFEALQHMAREQFRRYQVEPVRRILERHIDDAGSTEALAEHFVALVLAPWQRSVIFNDPLPGSRAIHSHARQVTSLFLKGAAHGALCG